MCLPRRMESMRKRQESKQKTEEGQDQANQNSWQKLLTG